MNAPHSPSLLSGIQMAPRDPILGLTEAFNADRNPKKVNLGVGVYYDDEGEVPLLECVRRAERQLVGQAAPRNYLPIDVLPACCHNPTGVDLSPGQWTAIIDSVVSRGLIPFLDIAYQGFGDGLEADAAAVRQF